jgi:putative endonuclease
MPKQRSSSRPKPRNAAERRAAWWYRLRGYLILDTNCWIAGTELDIVARRGRTLVFCEVKAKSGAGYGDPLEMVTPLKVARIRRAAVVWLAAHPELEDLDVRFDVLAERAGRLSHLANAF